jgi:hypothetical protein
MNPIKGAQRLVRWLQNPVDTNQPGYAKEEGKKEDNRHNRLKAASKL